MVKHKSGFTNRVADALNRRSSLLVNMRVEVSGFDSFAEMLTTDPYFSMVIQDVQAGKKT